MKASRLRHILSLGIGAAVLAWCVRYLATSFEWGPVLSIVRRSDPLWLVLGGGGAIVAQFAIRTLRWRVMLRAIDCEARFLDLYFVTSISLSLSVLTPAQSGEALKVELLRRRGLLGRLPGYGSFLVERVADLLVVMALAALSLGMDPALVRGHESLAWALPLGAAGLGLGLVALWRVRPGGAVGTWLAHLRGSAGDLRTLAAVVGLTVLSWLVVAAGWTACMRSIDLNVEYSDTIALMSLVTMANLVAMLPGGLGISEVLFSVLLVRMGYPDLLSQAAAVIIRCQWLLLIGIGALHLAASRLAVLGPMGRPGPAGHP